MLKLLAKSVLIPLGLTAVALGKDAVTQKKFMALKSQHWSFQMKKCKILWK